MARPGLSAYGASKSAVTQLTRCWALEWAPYNINVNAVAPGFVDTGMIEEIPTELIREVVPMKRAGTSTEVAAVVAFLCSDGASYITGEVINVSGGII